MTPRSAEDIEASAITSPGRRRFLSAAVMASLGPTDR